MKWSLTVGLVLMLCCLSGAQTAQTVPREILDRIVDDDPNPLPRNLTPAELRLPLPAPAAGLRGGPPSGTVDTPAEYELNDGLLIRWGAYNSVLTELVVGVTTGDPEAMMYILATGPSQQSSASSILTSAGAEMDQVEFITYSSNTVWIRDYGPRFIFEDGSRAIVDHTYNRPRPLDNAFPGFLSTLWGEPSYDLPLTHGGGNFHLFSDGDAFMSSLILSENPGLTEQQVIDYFAAYENLNLTIYEGFPTSYDSTRHIDMWMMPVGDDAIIIGEYAISTGLPHTITENAVADLISRGYTVYRTPGWRSGGTHYTYTNAVVLNDLVLISKFNAYPAQNAEALQVYEEAYPNHQIVQVDCSGIIGAAGAIHCIVMHVPAYTTTLRVTPGVGLIAAGPVGGPFTPASVLYTLENTSDAAISYSVTASETWLTVTGGSGSIAPQATVEVTVSINTEADTLGSGSHGGTISFANLTDHDGDTVRPVELIVGEPEMAHQFPLDSDPGWSRNGEWAFGQPLGQGGVAHGAADPIAGATGTNVFGINLAGDYSTTPGGPHLLTTDPIDCSGLTQVSLRFERWLNTDFQPYVSATLQVSVDGASWTPVWQNGGAEIVETSWSQQIHDISDIADDEAALQIRWGHQVGNNAWAYSGWNLDDVEIWGIPSTVCLGFQRGDANQDGVLDISDAVHLLVYLFGSPANPLDCHDTGDANDDGVLDISDPMALLTMLFAGGAPLPPPTGACGDDPTADPLGCESYPPCCL
ncbi:MAG: agmatine deiminase family protein [Planctomycetota bacterium]